MTWAYNAFRGAYHKAFAAFLRSHDEADLQAAYELGRNAMLEKLSVLEIASVHHEVLFGALGDAPAPAALQEVAEAGSTFFLEVLSTYEMVQRGLAEAQETARLEQRHAEQLRRLADASVAIGSAVTVDEITRRIAEHAVLVLGTTAAAVTARPARVGAVTYTHPPDVVPYEGRSSVECPLLRRNGSRLGSLELFADGPWTLGRNAEAILTQLSRVAGVALENVELYEQERLVAETLQERLLPGDLPRFPGVEMAWRYLPGWRGSDVGGDWYDAMSLPDDRLALAVGDVMGKGIGAAAGMGQLRVALRAYAIEGHDPAGVIRRMDQIVEQMEEEIATLVYLVYDPAAATLRYANAGHPPPLLISPDGSIEGLTGALSPPLGSLLANAPDDDALDVKPGSTLVVYTDGLFERRGMDVARGLARLERVAAAGDPSDLSAFCDHLLAGMDAGNRGDDIALLTARLGAAGG